MASQPPAAAAADALSMLAGTRGGADSTSSYPIVRRVVTTPGGLDVALRITVHGGGGVGGAADTTTTTTTTNNPRFDLRATDFNARAWTGSFDYRDVEAQLGDTGVVLLPRVLVAALPALLDAPGARVHVDEEEGEEALHVVAVLPAVPGERSAIELRLPAAGAFPRAQDGAAARETVQQLGRELLDQLRASQRAHDAERGRAAELEAALAAARAVRNDARWHVLDLLERLPQGQQHKELRAQLQAAGAVPSTPARANGGNGSGGGSSGAAAGPSTAAAVPSGRRPLKEDLAVGRARAFLLRTASGGGAAAPGGGGGGNDGGGAARKRLAGEMDDAVPAAAGAAAAAASGRGDAAAAGAKAAPAAAAAAAPAAVFRPTVVVKRSGGSGGAKARGRAASILAKPQPP